MQDNTVKTQEQCEENYVLIGSEVSLFTTKVRAYLDWRHVKYERMLPSDGVYKQIILPMTSIAMIPVVLVSTLQGDGEPKQFAIQDSKLIIQFFEDKITSSAPSAGGRNGRRPLPAIPATPKRRFLAMLLELIADEWLLLQAMYWRWSPQSLEKQQMFLEYEFGESAMGGQGSFEEKMAIGRMRTKKFAAFCPGLGISSQTAPAIEKQFRHLLALLSTHLERNKFMLGDEPTIADFAFYGSFYAHLSRDPVPGFIIKSEAPLVAAWIERITLVRENTTTKQVDDDNIPDTVFPILQFLLEDFMPILSILVDRTLAFLAANPQKEIPRRLGTTNFQLHIGGDVLVEGTRNVSTHGIWMLQRILDMAYVRVERQHCDEVMDLVSGKDSMIVQQWRGLVQRWERSGLTIARNERNQLVAQGLPESKI